MERESDGRIVKVVLDGPLRLGAKIKQFLTPEEVQQEGLGSFEGRSETWKRESTRGKDDNRPFCILVTKVEEGGMAERAKLVRGDKLILVDNVPVESFSDYIKVRNILQHKRPLELTFISFSKGEDEEIPKPSKRQMLLYLHESALRSASISQIRQVARSGLMERFRPVFWRVLLNYLPPDMSTWNDVLNNQRSLYRSYQQDFLKLGLSSGQMSSRPSRLKGQGWWETDSPKEKDKDKETHTEEDKELGHDDQQEQGHDQEGEASVANNTVDRIEHHPLESPLQDKLQDELDELGEEESHDHDVELRETIWKDVQRTHPGFHFFADHRCEVMERILFIYAKLNPGIEYVQGMNELVAPILFVFGNLSLDAEKDLEGVSLDLSPFCFEDNYEADTFFCFCNLMGDLRDLYMQGMDTNQDGITGKGEALMRKLQSVDVAVYEHLVEQEVNPQFFALRWLTTLLSRELMLPDTVRLWDTIFSDPRRFDTLFQVCCAMMTLQRDNILASDFAGCVQILQKYPPTDLLDILACADQIRQGATVVKPTLVEDVSRAASSAKRALMGANVSVSNIVSATSDLFRRGNFGALFSDNKST